jgi:hypothetical protein
MTYSIRMKIDLWLVNQRMLVERIIKFKVFKSIVNGGYLNRSSLLFFHNPRLTLSDSFQVSRGAADAERPLPGGDPG